MMNIYKDCVVKLEEFFRRAFPFERGVGEEWKLIKNSTPPPTIVQNSGGGVEKSSEFEGGGIE